MYKFLSHEVVLTSEIYYITFYYITIYEKAHLILDFRKKKSPQVGLEPTKMRQDLKKSVYILPAHAEKIILFGCDFSYGETLWGKFWGKFMGKLIWKACQRNCSWSKAGDPHLHLFCWFNNQDIHLLNIINSNWINAKYHQMVWALKRIVFKSHLFSPMSWKSTFEPRSYCAPYLKYIVGASSCTYIQYNIFKW